ncbi:MAG TPA: class I adenylate-forming enzyme family protein [Halioglobus sp.]
MANNIVEQKRSIIHGVPSHAEAGIGALTIPGYLREVTTRFAEREAVVMHAADGLVTRWSYSTLWDKSVEVAKALIAGGIGCDTRVGILMTNRPEYLAALFGTALAGGVPVVFSTFSTPTELEQLLSLSAVSVLLFEASVLKTDFCALLAALEPRIRIAAPGQLGSEKFPYLRQLIYLDAVTVGAATAPADMSCLKRWDEYLHRGASIVDHVVDARAATRSPADAGGLFFSSGTTSLPKGILHSQRAFALQWWRYPRLAGVDEVVRCWTANGLFWSGNITLAVGLAFTTGGTLVLQPYFEPEATLDLIEKERISFLHGRPHQWARMQESAKWKTADLGSLRYITRGDILREHPTVASTWTMPMGYGNTETLSICTSRAYEVNPDAEIGSFGIPLPGVILKIVDAETGKVLPIGSSGEICVKGPTLMLGYIGKAVEETFDQEGYFHTGDGGYVDEDGRLFWQGRITEIIKTGGANVSPVEIDEALALYPGVRRAQTVGLPHETMGEVIVSCIVPYEGVTLEIEALNTFLKARLASYKLPKQILFFREEELEITGSGKVKVMQLRQLVSSRL